jgi:hypothetical protein
MFPGHGGKVLRELGTVVLGVVVVVVAGGLVVEVEGVAVVVVEVLVGLTRFALVGIDVVARATPLTPRMNEIIAVKECFPRLFIKAFNTFTIFPPLLL